MAEKDLKSLRFKNSEDVYKVYDETARQAVDALEDVVDGKQSKIDAQHKLSVDLVDGALKSSDLEGLASEEYVDGAIETVEGQIPDVSGLASKTELAEAVNGLATEQYVDEAIADIDIPDFSSKQDVLTPDDTISIQKKIVAKKNLVNPEDPFFERTAFINGSGTRIATKGEDPASGYADIYGHTGLMPVKAGKAYTISSDMIQTVGNWRVHAYDADGNWTEQVLMETGSTSNPVTFPKTVTAPNNAAYLLFNFVFGGTGNTPMTWAQMEEGAEATTYEPYQEEEITEIGAHIDMEAVEETVSELVDEAIAELDVVSPANKIHNPKCRMDKDTFRVLDIGNSFTQDCTNYMPSLVTYLTTNKGLDVSNMSFSSAYRGGASYKNWFDIFHDKDTSSYTISKVFGGLTETYNGTAAAGNGEKFRKCLQEHKFDLIIIHQVSTYSGTYEKWEGTGADGYLKEFVRLLRYYQPQAHIGFLMVHASPRQMASGETTTREQWQRIANGAKWIAQNYGMDFVIPAGTAVENLRISKWGHIDQDTTKGFVAHQLTRDNHHMADGLCRYTGTCAYWETVFAPYFGITSYNCGWTYQSVTPPSGYEQDTIQVTAYNAQAAQMATMLAVNDMYTLNNPDGLYIGPEDEVPPEPEPEPDLRPDPTPLPDENYNILTSYTATAGTAREGATSQPLNRIAETGTMVPGFCNFGFTGNTGVIQDCSNNKGLSTNHSTNSYFVYDKLLPLGTVVQIPAGIKARVQYYNNTTNKYIRYESEIGGTESTTLVLGSELDLTRFNDLQPDGAYVHFYATADGGQGGAVVDVAFIESRLSQYQIVIKTPKSADPLDGYTQVTLSAPDNMENGWWGYAASTNASTTTNTAGTLLPLNDANGAHVAGSVGPNTAGSSTINCNGPSQVFIRPKESLVIPINSYFKVPEGYSCRPNFVKTDQYWWRSATTITAGEYVKLDPDVFAPNAGVTFDRVYMSMQKTADSGTGKRDATFTDQTAINTYINAKVAEGIELWVPDTNS